MISRIKNKIVNRLNRYFLLNFSNIIKYRLFSNIFAPYLEEWDPDVIHAHDLITLPLAVRVSKKTGSRIVYDAHELETHRNPPPPGYVKRYVRRIEKKNIVKADAVITVCDPIADYLAENYKISRPHIVLNSPQYPPREPDLSRCALKDTPQLPGTTTPHWAARSDMPRGLRREAGINRGIKLGVYVGFVTLNRGLETVIQALPFLEGVHFCAVGPRNEKVAGRLRDMAERLQVEDRFRLVDPVPPEQVVDFVRDADFGISPIWPITLSYDWAMPNKLFEMSFAGLPIVASNLDLISRFVLENRLGRIYHYDDPIDLARNVTVLLNDYEKYCPNEQQILDLRKRFDWDAQTEVVASIYDKLLKSRRK